MLLHMFLILFSSSLIMNALCDDPCSSLKGKTKTTMECCKSMFSNDSVMDKEDERIFKEGKCESSNTHEEFKCFLKERGLMSGNKPNVTAYTAWALGPKPQDIWVKIIQDTVKECLNKMEGKKEPYDYLMDCYEYTMFVNCPKSEWTENDTCNGLKKQVVGCLSQLN